MLSKTNVIANNHVKNAVDIERDSRTKTLIIIDSQVYNRFISFFFYVLQKKIYVTAYTRVKKHR